MNPKDVKERKPNFPIDYGKPISFAEDESRLNNPVVKRLADERVQKAIVVALTYGPTIANALDIPIGLDSAPEMGGNFANANPANPEPGAEYANFGNAMGQKSQRPSPLLLPRSQKTSFRRKLNTVALFDSVFVVCLNGFWNVPVGAAVSFGSLLWELKECAPKDGEFFKSMFEVTSFIVPIYNYDI